MTTSHVFKALGALLAYPGPDLVCALPEIDAIVAAERRLRRGPKAAVRALIGELASRDLIELEERYVEMFDRGRKTSLHLFEHVHGDSRDRGQAMVDLKRVYADAGWSLAAHELPDYLPAVLEFVALAPGKATEILGDCAHVIRAIGEALQARDSPYSAVPAAILDLIGVAGLAARTHSDVAAEEKPLDEEWREEQVFFGPPNGQGCGSTPPAVAPMRFVPRQP